jgi:hypothetical protein
MDSEDAGIQYVFLTQREVIRLSNGLAARAVFGANLSGKIHPHMMILIPTDIVLSLSLSPLVCLTHWVCEGACDQHGFVPIVCGLN